MSDLPGLVHDWHLHNKRYVAYVRADDQLELDEQYKEIEDYAKQHHLKIGETFCDIGKPMTGLHHAFEALEEADGMIVCNLNRFVTHTDDRLLDLRPVLHRFVAPHEGKHLISIEEGINTSTAVGQMNALELVNELKDVV